MAGQGMARLGEARLGVVRHGEAGMARLGLAEVRLGEVRRGEAGKAKIMMTREEAQEIWIISWNAALETERQRAQLEAGEGFACDDPREWCFELYCSRHGLPPPPTILYPTASGMVQKHWNPEKQAYEEEEK